MKAPDFRRFGKCAVALGVVAFLGVSACGDGEDEDPAKKTSTGGTGAKDKANGGVVPVVSQKQKNTPAVVVLPLSLDEKEIFAQKAFSVIDDVIDAVADDSAADTGRAHTCAVAADGSVRTETTFVETAEVLGADLPKRIVSVTMTPSGAEVRKWVPPEGQALTCVSETGIAAVSWKTPALVEGLALTVTTQKGATKARAVHSKQSGATLSTVDSWTVGGRRLVTFSVPQPETAAEAESPTTVRTRKSISSSVTRTKVYSKSDGSEGTTTDVIVTQETAPLVVETVRDVTDGTLKRRTILSGTLVATDAARERRVEMQLANVEFELIAGTLDKCAPVSGQVAGSIYALSGNLVLGSFVIGFGAGSESGVTLGFNGEIAVSEYAGFVGLGCEMGREE